MLKITKKGELLLDRKSSRLTSALLRFPITKKKVSLVIKLLFLKRISIEVSQEHLPSTCGVTTNVDCTFADTSDINHYRGRWRTRNVLGHFSQFLLRRIFQYKRRQQK